METKTGSFIPETPVNREVHYKPLDHLKRDIRILTLFRGNVNEAISCKLEVVSLDTIDKLPSYVALSYTWGDQKQRSDIKVNDEVYFATLNLKVALDYLRDAETDIQLWVDAICINQNCTVEINSQLKLMREIFSRATETRVWLGIEGRGGGMAVELVNRLAYLQLEKSREEDGARPAVSSESKPWSKEADLIALQGLLTRPYWYRVWIVQEIAVSKAITIFYGRNRLSWDTVVKAAEYLMQDMEIQTIIYDYLSKHLELQKEVYQVSCDNIIQDGVRRILSIDSVRNDKMEPEESKDRPHDSLLYLLSNHRSAQATDANDKYLALAGLIAEDENIKSQQLKSSSVRATYMLAAESTSKQQDGPLDFLDFAGWPFNVWDLPSWTPDWSFTRDRAIPLLYWQIAGNRDDNIVLFDAPGLLKPEHPSRFSFEKKEGHLTGCLVAHGVLLDTINGVGFSRWSHDQIADVQNPPENHELRGAERNDDIAYPTSEALSDVFWKTCVINRAQIAGIRAPENWGDMFYHKLFQPRSYPDDSYSQWYEENRNFEIYGVRLEQIVLQQRKLRPDILPGEASEEILAHLESAFDFAVRYRRLATTRTGYLCLAPSNSRPGDFIAILADCSVPVVLRRKENHFEFVGTCYVHGIMEGGEAVKSLVDEVRVGARFEIW